MPALKKLIYKDKWVLEPVQGKGRAWEKVGIGEEESGGGGGKRDLGMGRDRSLTSIKSCNRHIIVSTITSKALSYIDVLIIKVMSSLPLLGNSQFAET